MKRKRTSIAHFSHQRGEVSPYIVITSEGIHVEHKATPRTGRVHNTLLENTRTGEKRKFRLPGPYQVEPGNYRHQVLGQVIHKSFIESHLTYEGEPPRTQEDER